MDVAQSVQQTSDSGFVITGYTWNVSLNNYDIILIKTNSFGDTLWKKNIGDTTENTGSSLQITSDGGFIIAGTTHASGNGNLYDAFLVRTNSLGNISWTKMLGGVSPDHGYFVNKTYDGGFIVTGKTASFSSPPGTDVYLVKTDTLGNVVTGISLPIINTSFEIFLYPNPFRDIATIDLPDAIRNNVRLSYEICDLAGRRIRREDIPSGLSSFSIAQNNLTDGVYLLKLISNNTQVAVLKFIVH